MPTDEECKSILFKLGIELGVSPKLIATRLLNDLDKNDLRSGVLTIDALRAHIEVWKANGMRDYVGEQKDEGQTQNPVSGEQVQKPYSGYPLAPPFVRYSASDLQKSKGVKDDSKKDDTFPKGQEVQGQNQGCAPRGDSDGGTRATGIS